ncbi:MAG TPA: ABC transporter permease [Candidatus Saccharimonadales bacterium]|nr:ABC transporter permease [Candidatus Saccharimonadales bacterium]
MRLEWGRALTVARREFRYTVTRKAFIISIVGLPAYFAFVFWASAVGSMSSRSHEVERFRSLAVVDSSGLFAGAEREVRTTLPSNPLAADRPGRGLRAQVHFFDNLASAQEELRDGNVSQVLVIPADYLERGRVSSYSEHRGSLDESGAERAIRGWLARGLLRGRVDSLRMERAVRPAVDIAEYVPGRLGNFELRDVRQLVGETVLPIALGLLLVICIMIGGQYLLQGLAEEKESRVLESMLCMVSPEELLAGKLLGLGGAGLTLVAAWIGIGGGVAGAAAGAVALQVSLGTALCAVAYFALGYLLFACMMAGVGSIASTAREAQQFSVVFSILLMFPMFFVQALLENPDSRLAVGLSLFPPTAPMAMMLRLASPGASVPGWQVALSLALLAVASWFVLKVSARIFRIGMLAYGKPPNLAEVLRWARAR